MRWLLFSLAAACGSTPESGLDGGLDGGDGSAGPEAQAPVAVRVMAANISSGNAQSYEDVGIRIFQGLHPDVVLAQEFNYPSGARALVDKAFGTQFSFYVETGAQIPNAIVSRYPIVDSGTWVDASVSNRGFVWARIHVPGPIDLFAVSLHLLTTGPAQRDTEAKQVAAYVQANAPSGVYVVIGGDLNTDAPNEPAMSDLASVASVAPPYPADQNGNSNTSINRNHPHDWLLASTGLQARAIPLVIAASSYPAGLVFDSRVYTPLADVAPILATDSAAPGMQHMPVVRDFSLD